MDQKLFEQKLSEVAEWTHQKHQGQTYDSKGRNDTDSDTPTYIAVTKLKDRPCPYNHQHKNCDITVKATLTKKSIYTRRCRSCQGIIVNGQWYDGRGIQNTARFTEKIINGEDVTEPSSATVQMRSENDKEIIRINPTEPYSL